MFLLRANPQFPVSKAWGLSIHTENWKERNFSCFLRRISTTIDEQPQSWESAASRIRGKTAKRLRPAPFSGWARNEHKFLLRKYLHGQASKEKTTQEAFSSLLCRIARAKAADDRRSLLFAGG